MMYEDLIDAVSSIIGTYGAEIVADSRFWNILSDSFSFSSYYSLRKVCRMCISNGYLTEILLLKDDTNRTVNEITDIISRYDGDVAQIKDELAATLFSVAIAIGSCSKADYADFINLSMRDSFSTYSQSQPQYSPSDSQNSQPITQNPQYNSNNTQPTSKNTQQTPQPQYGQNRTCGFKGFVSKYLGMISVAVTSVGIGTLLYGAYIFSGWSTFLVLFLIGIVQLVGCLYIQQSLLNEKDLDTRSKIASFGLPITIVSIINILASFFFQSVDFRCEISRYFSAWQPDAADLITNGSSQQVANLAESTFPAPGALSLLLAMLFIVLIIVVSYRLFRCVKTQSRFKMKYALFSFALMALTEGVIFLSPLIAHIIQKENYLGHNRHITEQMNARIARNDALIASRAHTEKDLSFKGIKLGEPWDAAVSRAQAIVEADTTGELNPDGVVQRYFYTSFEDNADALNTLSYSRESKTPAKRKYSNLLTGEILKFNTSLDNTEVHIKVFGIAGKVYAIIVLPPMASMYSNSTFVNIEGLISLYTSKYGESEMIRDRSYYEQWPYLDHTIFGWTFKNGIVRVSNRYVAYVPQSFFPLAEKIATTNRELREEKERRIEYQQFRQDSIKRAKEIADSFRQVQNHQNAINEI